MTPKIGDKFKMNGWVWTIDSIFYTDGYHAKCSNDCAMYIPFNLADSLDWIKPEVTISKEAADLILDLYAGFWERSGERPTTNELHVLLSSMIE